MNRIIFKLFLIFLFTTAISFSIIFIDPIILKNLSWEILFSNITPLFILFIIIYGIFRRICLSSFITTATTLTLFIINKNKISNLQEPLMFSDFYLLPQMISGWKLMQLYLHYSQLILGIIIFSAIFHLLYKLEKINFKFQYGITLSLIGFLGGYFLINGNHAPATFYGDRTQGSTPWIFSSLAEKQGLIASLISGARITSFTKPTFDQQLINDFINNQKEISPHSEPPKTKPDIVLWLSESFFDPSALNGIKKCQVWPLLCTLQERGISSTMNVSTFGGNTTRTEFEVLTGVPFSTLKGHDYPYISVVNTKTQSIAWQLQNQGYKTIAIHPHNRTFWQRHKALPLLGFQQFDGEETFAGAKRSGYYIADHYLNNHVQQYLADADAPTFILAISMENHGPWGTGSRHSMDKERLLSIPTPESLQGEARLGWKEYVYHGENSLHELAELANFINSRERPTIVVFFGDHLPGLNNVFDQLKFKNGKAGPAQQLPFIALSNYQLGDIDWMPQNAYDLGLWTLKLAGQLGEGNYKELEIALQHARKSATPEKNITEALKSMQIRQLH